MVRVLQDLLWTWHQQLRAWCLDGSLSRSASTALGLIIIPTELQDLLESWQQGNFQNLPSIEAISDPSWTNAQGAYAAETRSIYLNEEWLASATTLQAINVLNEELGHHLDALFNAIDTPGDEGELFARLLENQAIDSATLQGLKAANDHGVLASENQAINVEFSSNSPLGPGVSQTYQVSGNQLNAKTSFEGIQRHTVRLTLSDGTYATQTGYQQQYSAFDGPSATITLELASDAAPGTVENFLSYIGSDYYTGTIFHRVINGFMIQGGGFVFNGTSIQQKATRPSIALETTQATGLSNLRGTLAMARTNDPNSATSQFFINTVDNLVLNYSSNSQPGYAVFGAVSNGMETVDSISKAIRPYTITLKGTLLENLTEPIVTITSAALLDRPTGLSFRVETPVQHGDLVIDPASGTFRYAPSTERKDDYFSYWVTVPAWAGMAQRQILRDVNLLVDEGPGKALGITSSIPEMFTEGVLLEANGVKEDPDGDASDPEYSYQWFKNGIPITGASSSSYRPGPQGQGNYKVQIGYQDSQGFRRFVDSPEQLITAVNDGIGMASGITSSTPGVFEEGVTLQAGSIQNEPDGGGTATGYQWYRNGVAIEGATSKLLQIPINSISPDESQDSYYVDTSYVDDQGFNEGPIRSEAVTIIPMRTLTSERDWITGRSGTSSYAITNLRHSPLAQYDSIINYTSEAKIDAPGSTNILLTKPRGTLKVKSIEAMNTSARSLTKLLSSKAFKTNQAAALIVKQGKQSLGTAIVLNNEKPGFQVNSDAVIFLENFIISGINPVQLI